MAMPLTSRFELFTRLGFAARGALYLIIAYLAIEAGRAAGSADALRALADGGPSQIALFFIALGLLAYGTWRGLEAWLDLEGAGDGAKGAGVRLGHAGSGIAHVVLGLLALGLALGIGTSSSGEGAESATEWVLGLPGGESILKGVALGFLAAGLAEGWNAYRLQFLKQLEPEAARKGWVRWVGRLGYIARGVVFVLIGLLLWEAAGAHNPQQAGGTADALASLSDGKRMIVAAGLGLFGVFSIVQAVYRRINNPHVLSRLRAGPRFA